VLDRDLPGMHGDDVCRTVRDERPETGILMLTAAGTLEDVVQGLSLGADDYLPKPFRFAELVARIHALARRASPSRPPVLSHGDLELDPARRTLTRAGEPVELARKEFAVLETLMDADGATVSAEELLERVWDEHTDPFTNVVRMTIMTLRRKLGDPAVIETVIGVGYRLI
jgi:two-component system, OmpR family, response regulator VanR